MLEQILKQLEGIEGIYITVSYDYDKITGIKISELERVSSDTLSVNQETLKCTLMRLDETNLLVSINIKYKP